MRSARFDASAPWSADWRQRISALVYLDHWHPDAALALTAPTLEWWWRQRQELHSALNQTID